MSEGKEEAVVEEGFTENGNWRSDDFVAFEQDDDEEKESDVDYSEELMLDHQQLQVSGETLPPWMTNAPRQGPRRVNPLVALHNEIIDFCRLMEPTPHEIQERQDLVERFTKVAYTAFGKDKASSFIISLLFVCCY